MMPVDAEQPTILQMTFPLLRELLWGCTVVQIRSALFHFKPGITVPKRTKAVLIDVVLQNAGESAIRHREVCNDLLKTCVKQSIDLLTGAYPTP